MMKVMIVDDEMLARTGIKVLIPWQEHGFDLVGECDNGGKALEMAERLEPDIIITDIMMPVLDGIGLIRQCKERGLHARFIVLSTYGDFSYVKEAMRLGADDYLLKLEVEAEGLLDALRNVRDKLESEKDRRERQDVLEKQFMEQAPVFKERLLKGLLRGEVPGPEELQRQLSLVRLPLEERNLVCLVLQIDNGEPAPGRLDDDSGLLELSIIHVIEETLGLFGKGAACWMRTGVIAVVVTAAEQNSALLERLAASLRNVLEQSLNVRAAIGVSRFCERYADLHAAYSDACCDCEQRGGTDRGDDFKEALDVSGLPFSDELGELEACLRTYQPERMGDAFARLSTRIVEDGSVLSRRQLARIGHAFIYILGAFVKNQSYISGDFWAKYGGDPYKQIESLTSGAKLAEYVNGLRGYLLERLAGAGDESLLIIKAKQYIQAHYMEELSLKTVAEYLGLSPNYFSRLFSKATDMTFIDYVIEQRIEKAKELLRDSSMKVGEIAERIGYDNPHYFSRIFRKVTGYSPSEFKS